MDGSATSKHRFEEQDVRAGGGAGESDAGIHGGELFLQEFADFPFLGRRKPRRAAVRRVDHVPGEDDELRNGEAIIKGIGAAVEVARERASLSPSRRKRAQVITLRRDRGAISFLRLVGFTQDNKGFSYRRMLPVVIRLCLANLQNGFRYAD